jgi:hypothetical protein
MPKMAESRSFIRCGGSRASPPPTSNSQSNRASHELFA